ncbi:hypothetical protein GCM10022281_07170 [Sphingomonas rosea]|uniref:Lipoprotein n=1 Tax=Sphingomonas rosea TaxID=335605 RepID=A0ABP7TTM7_9SPHN
MKRVAALVACGLLAGCATRPAPEPVRVPPRVDRPSGSSAGLVSPQEYVGESASRTLLLVRAAELIAERVPGLTSEADRIAAGQRGIAAQLNLAGRRLNILPSATLRPAHAAELQFLERSADPARAWRSLAMRSIDACIIREKSYAERGSSPTLRPVARFAASVCEEQRTNLK